MAWVDALLRRMVDEGCSDLHLTATLHPRLRRHGEIIVLDQEPVLNSQEMERALREMTPDSVWEVFASTHDADFAYAIEGVGRFRVNLFLAHTGPAAVLRLVPQRVPTIDELGLPEAILRLLDHRRGLVLVTGPTGSGKSTTLAAMIDHINRTRAEHILTIEDPIEFVHENRRCLVRQREVSRHTRSFQRALRAALREDPDVVLVGEMRDLETVAIAIETAETGHLVFGTLHTNTAPSTVNRIIDQFPADRQGQIRQMLASSLRGVVAQTLCRRRGGGRVAAHEILVCNAAVSALIREGKTHQILSAMQVGKKDGMRLLNDSLAALVREGVVELEEALSHTVDRDDLRRRLGVPGPTDEGSPDAPRPAPVTPNRSRSSDGGAPVNAPVASGQDDDYVDPFEEFRRRRKGGA